MPGSTSSIVGVDDGISGAAKDGATGAKSSAIAKTFSRNIISPDISFAPPSNLVFDVGLWPIRAARGLRVPATLFVFVLYGFCMARHGLLFGSGLRSGERVGVGRVRLREHAVNLVGPTAIVFDDLVGNVRHQGPLRLGRCSNKLSLSRLVAPV